MRCHGYHRERRTRRVSYRDDNGGTHYRTETYYVTVTDFNYKIDITGFIFPYGYIHSVDKRGTDVLLEITEFHASTNKLKTLEMHKEVHGFDFGHLRRMVYGYIRALGWWRGLSVTFPRANYRVKIWTSNCLSNCWENCFGKCLCYLSIIGCIIMPVKIPQNTLYLLEVVVVTQLALWPGFFSFLRSALCDSILNMTGRCTATRAMTLSRCTRSSTTPSRCSR